MLVAVSTFATSTGATSTSAPSINIVHKILNLKEFTLFCREFENVVNRAFLVLIFWGAKVVGAKFYAFCNYDNCSELHFFLDVPLPWQFSLQDDTFFLMYLRAGLMCPNQGFQVNSNFSSAPTPSA